MDDDPEIRDIAAWCKATAREGARALQARRKGPAPKQLTDVESAAIARKKLDERSKP